DYTHTHTHTHTHYTHTHTLTLHTHTLYTHTRSSPIFLFCSTFSHPAILSLFIFPLFFSLSPYSSLPLHLLSFTILLPSPPSSLLFSIFPLLFFILFTPLPKCVCVCLNEM